MFEMFQDGRSFMPHGMCFLWEPELVWLHALSDVFTGAAYYAIPPTLLVLVVRARRQVPEGAEYASRRLPHEWMFLMFGLFIVACGTTHLLAAWNIWNSAYWLSGGVKAVTALASVATAVALPPLVPRALELVRAARESELRRTQLEAANRELAELNERLRAMDEQKTSFFANVTHELRTPLTLILGPIEQQLGEVDDPTLRGDLELVQRNARLLERRVQDLLDVASEGVNEVVPRYRSFDLVDTVKDTFERFSGAARSRGVRLELEAPEPLPVVLDAEKMERVVDNLVTNAFKFVPEGGTIRATLYQGSGGDDSVVLEIADDGPGIPVDERDRIFERFHRVAGAGVEGKTGSGLGLAIVRQFVHLLRGDVAADSDPRLGGARVTIRLPARPPGDLPIPGREELADEARAEDSPLWGDGVPGPGPVSGAPDPGTEATPGSEPLDETALNGYGSEIASPRVLVVEDTPDMRQFLRRTLAAGHTLRVASGGEEALRILDEWAPDLILTDLMMPGMDGEAFVEAVRSRDPLRDVPVMVLSARAERDMRVRLLRQGAQDYVTKPFAADELKARVRNLLAMKRVRDLLRSELQNATGDVQSLAAELGRRHRELESALQEVRHARDEAESASRAKSEFLAVMSHELRTPLNAIIGYTEILETGIGGEVTAEQRQHLRRIRLGARHLLKVIEDILNFSRDRSGGRPMDAARVDLDELVDEVVEELRPEADTKGLELVADVPAASMVTDRERLRRILTNLVSNAVKFSDEGTVRVDATAREREVELAVRDTGIGIDPEHQARIFDDFWQVDQSSTRKAGGTGLGLSIVKRLVEQLDGSIEVRSQPGEGSTFVVRLPREPGFRKSNFEGQRQDT